MRLAVISMPLLLVSFASEHATATDQYCVEFTRAKISGQPLQCDGKAVKVYDVDAVAGVTNHHHNQLKALESFQSRVDEEIALLTISIQEGLRKLDQRVLQAEAIKAIEAAVHARLDEVVARLESEISTSRDELVVINENVQALSER